MNDEKLVVGLLVYLQNDKVNTFSTFLYLTLRLLGGGGHFDPPPVVFYILLQKSPLQPMMKLYVSSYTRLVVNPML